MASSLQFKHRGMTISDPELYIRSQEARVDGIRPGCEKQIVWAAPDKQKTRYAIVYIHGFSASAGEARPLPDKVAAALAANLFFTRLTGHGIDGAALGRARIKDWLEDVAEAIAIGEALGDKIILMGTSTGGALATWALTQPHLARPIAAAILISPNYRLKATGAFLLNAPFARQIVHAALGRTRNAEARTELQRRIWTGTYPTEALLPMARAVTLAWHSHVNTISKPTLFFYAPTDQIVDPAATVKMASRWGGPHRLVPVDDADDPNGHVLTGDAYSPSTTERVFTQICSWLEETLRPNS